MKVAVLAGGVGGARMALGFARALPPEDLSIVVNVGDDERFHGLYVCPDLDTVVYTLAGVVDGSHGWGVAGDTTLALDVLRKLGSPGAWMKLGDSDLGLHIYRTARLNEGISLTRVMDNVRVALEVACRILPVSDDECPTEVLTSDGTLRFQEWFVRDRAQPAVRALKFDAASRAETTPQVRDALRSADLIVFAPSNPLLSIQPMLEIGGMRGLLETAPALKVAISPLISGRAVKGPLVKLMQDLGRESSNAAIAASYAGIVDVFVVDDADAEKARQPDQDGMEVVALPTLIPDGPRAETLAKNIISFVGRGR